MKLTSALGGIGLKQADVPYTSAKSVTPCY